MTKVWHAITHDLMCSISTQLDQLYISSMHHFNDIQRQKDSNFCRTLSSYHGKLFFNVLHAKQPRDSLLTH